MIGFTQYSNDLSEWIPLLNLFSQPQKKLCAKFQSKVFLSLIVAATQRDVDLSDHCVWSKSSCFLGAIQSFISLGKRQLHSIAKLYWNSFVCNFPFAITPKLITEFREEACSSAQSNEMRKNPIGFSHCENGKTKYFRECAVPLSSIVIAESGLKWTLQRKPHRKHIILSHCDGIHKKMRLTWICGAACSQWQPRTFGKDISDSKCAIAMGFLRRNDIAVTINVDIHTNPIHDCGLRERKNCMNHSCERAKQDKSQPPISVHSRRSFAVIVQ